MFQQDGTVNFKFRYRAPEVLLRSTQYSSPIDIWAVGTIIAELFTLQPLFPGTSEIDEIFKISSLCGSPKPETFDSGVSIISRKDYDNVPVPPRDKIIAGGPWQDGIKLALAMGFKFPIASPVSVAQHIPNAPDEALQLVADMLQYNPGKRPTASESIRHPWFADLTSKSAINSPQTLCNVAVEPQTPVSRDNYRNSQGYEHMPPISNINKNNKLRSSEIHSIGNGHDAYGNIKPFPDKQKHHGSSEFSLYQSEKLYKPALEAVAPKQSTLLDKFHFVDPGPPKPIQNARKYPISTQTIEAPLKFQSKFIADNFSVVLVTDLVAGCTKGKRRTASCNCKKDQSKDY